jgi:hypothetical protein
MAGALLKREGARQQRAFESYYALGFGRSYASVARELGVSVATVKLWGRSFGWQERVRERDLDVARAVADRTFKGETEGKGEQLKIVRMAMLHVAKEIAERKVRVTIGDLDRLIRLEKFLSDEPDSRVEHTFGDLAGKSREELQLILAQEIAAARELSSGADLGT